jgi:hypothetical protein
MGTELINYLDSKFNGLEIKLNTKIENLENNHFHELNTN